MNGMVILDKEKGVTSQKVVMEVKRALKIKRAGHTGTLDPFATGVLPICLGDATKLVPFLDDSIKEYEAVLRLGIATDTMDEKGKVLYENKVIKLTLSDILDVFSKYKGEVRQTPPMFSAENIGGVCLTSPLYFEKTSRISLRVNFITLFSYKTFPFSSMVSVAIPSRNTASYSLMLSSKNGTSFVASPKHIGRTPVANGSSVPVGPLRVLST